AGIGYGAPGSPPQLPRPEGVEVGDISPGPPPNGRSFFAVPETRAPPPPVPRGGGERWVRGSVPAALPVTAEVARWVDLALREVPRRLAGDLGRADRAGRCPR